MKHTPQELEELSALLESKLNFIKSESLIKVTSSFNKFYSSYSSCFKLLCDENIIKEDPYKEDYELDKLVAPDDSPIGFNEEEYVITIRLSHYYALLTHIKEKETVSINLLNIENIKKIEVLLDFINWDRIFDPQPMGVNREALNKVMFQYQKNRGKAFALQTLKATASNIDVYLRELKSHIDVIRFYQEEKYKFWVRENILTQVKLPSELKGENIKKAHDLISDKIQAQQNPLHIHLVGEVLKEDFSADGDGNDDGVYDAEYVNYDWMYLNSYSIGELMQTYQVGHLNGFFDI